ncbi:ribosomal L28e protein family-domain-containing protein [Pterulicium gracile]|uniref:Ribosomal L28e protein family-domain-containing protein n=1 Tax=Pterulicium gracile TaxID=1884261 RepID=A0A5C3QYY4_9AGAR|nr:ribosomal L28e protein family-domain-containing protein [Pterula gracilis]
MSNDLTWLLLRNNNSFLVKRVPEGPVFSKEPGNLRNLHSAKYSGLVNNKTIDVSQLPNGAIQVKSRKAKTTPHTIAKAHHTTTIRPRSGGRRALGITSSFARRGYRPDLRTAALSRVSALQRAQREPKAPHARKTRGNKSKAAAAAAAATA